MDGAGNPKSSPTLGEHVRKALREARAWRPLSFHMLAATPLVLLLAWGLLAQRDKPAVFALGLSALFLFFGVLTMRALLDVVHIARRHLNEHRESFRQTIGEEEFAATLGRRVRERERNGRGGA